LDRSEVKRIVESNIVDMKYRLGLGQWDVRVEFDLRETPPGEAACFVTRGQNTWHIDYETALIKLDPDQLETEEDVLDVLRHELFHLLAAPLSIARNALKPLLEADPVRRDMVDSVWTHAVERVIKNIERMHRGLTRKDGPAPAPSAPEG
jgi:hypothetical protein